MYVDWAHAPLPGRGKALIDDWLVRYITSCHITFFGRITKINYVIS